jgi:hypothetical protein
VEERPTNSDYDHCVSILGQTEAALPELAEKLADEAQLALDNNHVRIYRFSERGIVLVFSKTPAQFTDLSFFVNTPAVRRGDTRAYDGQFLCEIASEQSAADVEKKIDCKREVYTEPNGMTLTCDLADQRVTFFFDSSGAEMRLVLVQLRRHANTNAKTWTVDWQQ